MLLLSFKASKGHSDKTPSGHNHTENNQSSQQEKLSYFDISQDLSRSKTDVADIFKTLLYLLSSQARPGNVKLGMHAAFGPLLGYGRVNHRYSVIFTH